MDNGHMNGDSGKSTVKLTQQGKLTARMQELALSHIEKKICGELWRLWRLAATDTTYSLGR